MTGIVNSKGIVEMSLSKIRRAYMRSWMFMDVSLIFMDWVLAGLEVYFDPDMDTARSLRLFRLLRAIRLIKTER